MNKAYLITSKSRITNIYNSTKGQHAFAEKPFAEKLTKILNKKYKNLEHFVIEAPVDTPLLNIINYELSNINDTIVNDTW